MTLTGPGGVGKTRLAVAVGERLRDRFGAGTAFVPLDAVTDPGLVLAAIGRAAGADLAGAGSPLEALAETFGDGAWLLVLDNLEQVVQVAPDLGELLARCPGVAILATSRTVLGLRAEREYPVPPLALPADPGHRLGRGGGGLAGGGAVRGPGPRGAARLCPHRGQRGGGGGDLPAAGGPAAGDRAGRRPHPAAGPARAAGPAGGLAGRARHRRGGPARAAAHPARHRGVERRPAWKTPSVRCWRSRRCSPTAGPSRPPPRWRAWRRTGRWSCRRRWPGTAWSLSTAPSSGPGRGCWRPSASSWPSGWRPGPTPTEIGRRHAGFYRALAEQADRPLRGPGRSEWLERLQAEAGNLAAAVRWYLAHDRGPLPHLFRVL